MASRLDIIDMQAIALMMGGKCLSKEYWDESSPLSWRCEKGHNWDAPYSIIRQGSWCPQCTHEERKQIWLERLQEVAEKRGGLCLSAIYISNQSKIKWQCKKGHQWLARPSDVKGGTWCAWCAGKAKHTIEEMREKAQSRGGKCLSTKYVNSKTKLKWECSLGHTWETIPNEIYMGRWCPKCKAINIGNYRRSTIGDIRKLAESKGGKLLSEKYTGAHTPMKWQCSKGHQWMANAGHVKHHTWCPVCAQTAKHTIEEMHLIATLQKGMCLSKKIVNNTTKLKWKCANGHIWMAIPKTIVKGHWCARCSHKIKRITHEQIKAAIQIKYFAELPLPAVSAKAME